VIVISPSKTALAISRSRATFQQSCDALYQKWTMTKNCN